LPPCKYLKVDAQREIYKSAKPQIFPHYDCAKKLLRKRNSDHYREPQQRFTKPQTGLYTIRSARTVITDFKKATMHAIFQMLSVVSVLSTSANLGGAEFTPLVCQKTIDKNSAISKWLMFFRTVVVAFG